jgi:hypothetical protein
MKNFNEILSTLPDSIRKELSQLQKPVIDGLEEIRLRCGHNITLNYGSKEKLASVLGVGERKVFEILKFFKEKNIFIQEKKKIFFDFQNTKYADYPAQYADYPAQYADYPAQYADNNNIYNNIYNN